MPKSVISADSVERLTYSVAEIAKMLGVSQGFVYSRIAAGEIKVIRLSATGNTKRIPFAERERLRQLAMTGDAA